MWSFYSSWTVVQTSCHLITEKTLDLEDYFENSEHTAWGNLFDSYPVLTHQCRKGFCHEKRNRAGSPQGRENTGAPWLPHNNGQQNVANHSWDRTSSYQKDIVSLDYGFFNVFYAFWFSLRNLYWPSQVVSTSRFLALPKYIVHKGHSQVSLQSGL